MLTPGTRERLETGAVVTNRRGQRGVERGKEFAISGKHAHRIHIRRAHNEHNSMFTSIDGHICACGSRANGSRIALIFVRAEKNPFSGHPCRHRTCSLTAYHNTKHHLDSTIFSKNTLHILHKSYTMIFSENRKLIVLISRLSQGRKESLQVLSVTEIQSVRTLRTTHSTGYEPKSLATD